MTKKLTYLLAALVLVFASCTGNKKKADITPSQVESLVKEAYIHTFPFVENYKGIYFYGVLKESPKYTPMNTIINERKLYSPEDKLVVSPNNDTYYSTGILDLRAQPVIFKVPASPNRYYVFQLVDMATNNFGYIGVNTTGTEAGTYAITSPNFTGSLPGGVKEIKAPSEFIIVAGRTAVNAEDPKDIKEAEKLQDQYEVGVISKFYPDFPVKEIAPVEFPALKDSDFDNEEYFKLLNFLLQYTRLSGEDQKTIDKFKEIGIETGQPYEFVTLHPEYKEAVLNGIKAARAEINTMANNIGTSVNGWGLAPIADYFGDDYLLRTAYAKKAIYVNSPKEAYYPTAAVDADGEILDGKNDYIITFSKDQIPPAKYFWSLTMYDNEHQLLVANEINRYSIGDRTKGMKYNADGSLTLYLGHKKPKQGTTNWLAAPNGGFNVMMRIYDPKDSVLDGSWTPPAFQKIK